MFKALADPSRRLLLDRLFELDGQSLGELAEPLAMTRYGVMKHLRVLEAAGLVVTRRAGRRKLHFLNPVPIGRIHDRWISKYAEPWVQALAKLKSKLEAEPMDKPKHVYQLYIRATPEQLWRAITDGEMTRLYFHSTAIESDFKAGSPVVWRLPDGSPAVEGEIVAAEPPRKLVTTWAFRISPETSGDPPSRVSWEIDPVEGTDVVKLTLVHDGFATETATSRAVGPGWNPILCSLKSLLETGKALDKVAG